MQIGFGDINLVLRRRICVVLCVCVCVCVCACLGVGGGGWRISTSMCFFLLYVTKADGTRVLLRHLSVRWCWSAQNVNSTCTFHTQKQHPPLFEPIPWHICTLKPCHNLPWRCLRQRRRLRVFWPPPPHPPSCRQLCHLFQLTALKVPTSSPTRLPPPELVPVRAGLVRAKCASPCRCRLCLCIGITEDLGKKSGMPAHLMLLRKHMWIVHVAERHRWLLFTSS